MDEDFGTRVERVARAMFRAGPGNGSDRWFEEEWRKCNQAYWRNEAHKFLVMLDAANASSPTP